MALPTGLTPQGLYVHVPFCFHKCHYCDFYSLVDTRDRQDPYVDRLLGELEAFRARTTGSPATIFVGGGTPTLLGAARWRRVLSALGACLDLDDVEFTVEVNPETLDEELAATLFAGGVNRLSIGCQSFDPRHLKTLERWHDPESVERSVEIARGAGFERINLDLIFGIPGQTGADWERDLDRALALKTDHLSCYGLMYEPNTPLTARMRAGTITPLDEDIEAEMYEQARHRLAEAGLEHYEISAWARPGSRCRHNLMYWRNGECWPLGPGAAGHMGGWRWKNAPRLDAYLEADPWPVLSDIEPPDPERSIRETLMVGLRLIEGLALSRIEPYLESAERRTAVEEHLAGGLLERTDTHLRLTPRGLLLADLVIADVM